MFRSDESILFPLGSFKSNHFDFAGLIKIIFVNRWKYLVFGNGNCFNQKWQTIGCRDNRHLFWCGCIYLPDTGRVPLMVYKIASICHPTTSRLSALLQIEYFSREPLRHSSIKKQFCAFNNQFVSILLQFSLCKSGSFSRRTLCCDS